MVPEAAALGGHHVELVGELAAILGLAKGAAGVGPPDMRKPRRLAGAGGESLTAVAGARIANCFAMTTAIVPACSHH